MLNYFACSASRRTLFAALLIAATAPMSSAESATSSTQITDDPLLRRSDAPLEQIDGVSTMYTSALTQDGTRLRVLVSRAEGSAGPLHPLLFTQWVSCGSIEHNDRSGSSQILAHLARNSGLALIRVERSGTGDSDGPGCDQLGYDQEVQHYIDAFEAILDQDLMLTADKVFLYGSSLGSTTAPLVAKSLQDKGFNIGGVAVQGGGALSHYERMLNFERIYLERRPNEVPRNQILEELNQRAIFLAEYLLKQRHPDDIAEDSEAMRAVRQDIRGLGERDHYGRPFAWHQEAAQRDFLGAWAALDTSVLVIFNAFDQFEMAYGHALIADTVNAERPGTAVFIEQANIGHSNRRFESALAAYANENPEPAWRLTADAIVSWLNKQNE